MSKLNGSILLLITRSNSIMVDVKDSDLILANDINIKVNILNAEVNSLKSLELDTMNYRFNKMIIIDRKVVTALNHKESLVNIQNYVDDLAYKIALFKGKLYAICGSFESGCGHGMKDRKRFYIQKNSERFFHSKAEASAYAAEKEWDLGESTRITAEKLGLYQTYPKMAEFYLVIIGPMSQEEYNAKQPRVPYFMH